MTILYVIFTSRPEQFPNNGGVLSADEALSAGRERERERGGGGGGIPVETNQY